MWNETLVAYVMYYPSIFRDDWKTCENPQLWYSVTLPKYEPGFSWMQMRYYDMMPEGRNSWARRDAHC
jgi:hypothetical protein